MSNEFYNKEGYADPTAFFALRESRPNKRPASKYNQELYEENQAMAMTLFGISKHRTPTLTHSDAYGKSIIV